MRRLIFVLALLVALPIFAQQQPNAIFVFVSNPQIVASGGSHYEGAFGVAFRRMLGEHWSVQAAVSRDHERTGFITRDPSGNVIVDGVVNARSTPVDLIGYYHFVNGSSWKPYIGAGARWMNAPSGVYASRNVLATIDGGITWQFHPSLALRFDSQVLLGSRPPWADRVTGGFGLGWRF